MTPPSEPDAAGKVSTQTYQQPQLSSPRLQYQQRHPLEQSITQDKRGKDDPPLNRPNNFHHNGSNTPTSSPQYHPRTKHSYHEHLHNHHNDQLPQEQEMATMAATPMSTTHSTPTEAIRPSGFLLRYGSWPAPIPGSQFSTRPNAGASGEATNPVADLSAVPGSPPSHSTGYFASLMSGKPSPLPEQHRPQFFDTGGSSASLSSSYFFRGEDGMSPLNSMEGQVANEGTEPCTPAVGEERGDVRFHLPPSPSVRSGASHEESASEGYMDLQWVYSISNLHVFRAISKSAMSHVQLKVADENNYESVARLRNEWRLFSGTELDHISSISGLSPLVVQQSVSTVTSPSQKTNNSLSLLGAASNSSHSYNSSNFSQHPNVVSPMLMDYLPEGPVALVYDDKIGYKTAKEWFLPELRQPDSESGAPTPPSIDPLETSPSTLQPTVDQLLPLSTSNSPSPGPTPDSSSSLKSLTTPKARTHSDLINILSVISDVVDVLAVSHRLGIVHNNINPFTVLVSQGQPPRGYLSGWHHATRNERDPAGGHGAVPLQFKENLMPLQYAAPECTGRMNRSVDLRADFYSLGVMAYELFVGFLPFRSLEALELIHQHIAKAPDPPCEVNLSIPLCISNVILKMLQKNAEDRYQTANGLKVDLDVLIERLSKGISLDDYVVGEADATSQFIVSDRLYGREKVLADLLEEYETIRTNRESAIVLISGSSGTGKSRLVREIQKNVVRSKGYFTSGKFDQYKRSSSFFSLVQILQDLVRQVLSESTQNLAKWRVDTIRALDGEGAVLMEVVPELRMLLGTDFRVEQLPSLGPAEREQRFRNVFIRFLSIFARKNLVVFLDDLQRCSEAEFTSIANLIEIGAGTPNQSILLVGTYRNSEIGPDHPLNTILARANAKVIRLEIGPLDMDSVEAMIADTLHRPRARSVSIGSSDSKADGGDAAGNTAVRSNHDSELKTLTELVYAKTDGNAFFVTQLLKSLFRGGHIYYDFKERIWRFSLTTLEAEELPPTVVDLLVGQMMDLEKSARDMMMLASCLGSDHRLTLEMLAMASGKTQDAVAKDIWGAVDAGLLLPISGQFYVSMAHESLSQPDSNRYPATPAQEAKEGVAYRFLHDRVQQAAYSLIPTEKVEDAHRTIGKRLLAASNEDNFGSMIYEITSQLNFWTGPMTPAETEELMCLNYKAGKKALEATAFTAALGYFTHAKRLLDTLALQKKDGKLKKPSPSTSTSKLSISTELPLALDIHIALADGYYAQGNFEEAIAVVDKLNIPSSSVVERSRCYLVKMKCLLGLGNLLETVDTGLEALGLLGHKIPPDDDAALAHARRLRQAKRMDSIDVRTIRPMADRSKYEGDILLHEIATVVLLPVYMARPALLGSLCMTSFTATMESGLCIESAYPILMLAVLMASEGGQANLSRAWHFGNLAVQLVEREIEENTTPVNASGIYQVFAGHIAVFHRPMSEVIGYLNSAITTGQAVFDVDYTVFALVEVPVYGMFAGERLESVALKMNTAKISVDNLSQKLGTLWYLVPSQALKNLRGVGNQDPLNFVGEDMTAEATQDLLASESISHGYIFYMWQTILAVLFDKPEYAIRMYMRECLGRESAMKSTIYVSVTYFYLAVALIDRRENISAEETELLQLCMKSMRECAIFGKQTYQHKTIFLEAEYYKDQENPLITLDKFEEAISLANASQFFHDSAFINERCAKWMMPLSKKRGLTYLTEAYRLYTWWGATAKLQALRAIYAEDLGIRSRPPLSRNVSENAVPPRAMSSLSLSPRISRLVPTDDGEVEDQRSLTGSCMDDVSAAVAGGTGMAVADDYKTFMKASLYISEGVKMDEVVVKLMRSVLQTAGADYGVLIMEEDGNLFAETILFMEEVTILDHQPLHERPDLMPVSVANVVSKLGETVVKNGNDQKFESTYGRDPYFTTSNNPRSVLCMPIRNQIKIMGVLYLENKHVNHAFTSQRLELLNLLCTQAAVTIDKARLYRAMELAKKAAEEATEEKSSFLANMSHEIRTPFNALLSCSIFLLDTTLSEQQRDYVETIRSSANMILSVIDGILDFSKMEHGPIDLQKSPFSLRDCIESSLQLIAEPAATKDLELAFSNKCPNIDTLYGDVTRYRQIIINLLGNAVKFTEKGFILVTSWAEKVPGDEDGKYRIFVSVEDTGIGIPQNARDKLFRAFSQVDSSTRRRFGGSGLGLAISKKLAQSMGGDITFESTEGEGTTFLLTILAQTEGTKQLSGNKKLKGKRILLADTHPLSSKILADELALEGMIVIKTDNAEHTLKIVSEADNTIPVAIIDFSLDESMGIVKKIHKLSPKLKIIMQSMRFGTNMPDLNQFPNLTANIIRPSPRRRYITHILEALDPLMALKKPSFSLLRNGSTNNVNDECGGLEILSTLATRHPLNILLAEDNYINTKVALQHLKRMGYTTVQHAKDGIEVLEMCEAAAGRGEMFDVVLMDVMMPRSDGIETSLELRKRYPEEGTRPTIIALTANATAGDRDRCLEAGMTMHLAKPIKPDELATALMSSQRLVKKKMSVGE